MYFAWKQLFPSRSLGCVFTYLSLLGVAVSFSILCIVISIMNGFQKEIRDKITAIGGDIFVEISTRDPLDVEKWADRIGKENGVQSVAAVRVYPVFIMGNDQVSLAILKEGSRAYDGLFSRVMELEAYADNGIWVGENLANEMNMHIGEHVRIAEPQQMLTRKKNKKWLTHCKEKIVMGIFSSDSSAEEERILFVDRRDNEGPLDGFEVRLHSGSDAISLVQQWNKDLFPPQLHGRPWQENHRQLLSVLGLEKTAMYFILCFILLIAVFSIASALTVDVVKKWGEIGLLRAMGATRLAVGMSFLWQGFFLGAGGVLCGGGFTVIVLYFRDAILGYLLHIWGNGDEILAFYQFTHLPLAINGGEIVAIAIFSIITTTIAAIIPALRAMAIHPAVALAKH
ncbi:MAG: ABC transporter permease [Puniceicoccales bacterium]|nr:ABC transporter permease [Puniceicoccales bacterium]